MTTRYLELLRCAANARRFGLAALADHLTETAERYHRPLGLALTDKCRHRRRRAVAGPALAS